ncbi:MAG: hypothetical protein AAF211_34080, partial [Myxococcota bacterium]
MSVWLAATAQAGLTQVWLGSSSGFTLDCAGNQPTDLQAELDMRGSILLKLIPGTDAELPATINIASNQRLTVEVEACGVTPPNATATLSAPPMLRAFDVQGELTVYGGVALTGNGLVTGNGGILRSSGGFVWLQDARLAGGETTGDGGNIWLGEGASLEIRGESVISHGSSYGNGGCLAATQISTVSVSESPATIQYCDAEAFGGGLYIEGGSTLTGGGTPQSDFRVLTNTADRGGALYVTESISTLRHTQLHGNGARRTGGGLHATASTV